MTWSHRAAGIRRLLTVLLAALIVALTAFAALPVAGKPADTPDGGNGGNGDGNGGKPAASEPAPADTSTTTTTAEEPAASTGATSTATDTISVTEPVEEDVTEAQTAVETVASVIGVDELPVTTAGRTTTREDATHLRVTIGTSSDWTTVKYSAGTVVAQQPRDHTNVGTFNTLGDGWKLVPAPGTTASVTVDLVLRDTAGTSTFTITTAKGYEGVTRVLIDNVNGDPVRVLDHQNSSRTEPFTGRSDVGRDTLFAGELALTKADARKLVLAFYYPWYGHATYGSAKMSDRPVDQRSVWDPAGVLSMTQQARANGVDGFIVSWAGAENDGSAFDLALRAAEATSGVVSGYLEVNRAVPDGAEMADPVLVEQWLRELLGRSSSPAFLHHDGAPAVFVWDTRRLTVDQWNAIHARLLADGLDVALISDWNYPDGPFRGWHSYSPFGSFEERLEVANRRSLELRAPAVVGGDTDIYAATVVPGFDDHLYRDGNPVIERGENGERYLDTWKAALAADPDWILVNSWNEWYEGTSIEPGVAAGDLSLRQTAAYVERWREAAE